MSAYDFGTPKTLEANGVSIGNNGLAQADDATYGVIADGGNRAHARFVISVTFSAAPVENATIDLLARPINILSTNDAEVPEATRPDVFIKSFSVNNVTTTQYIEFLAENVPWEAEYYLMNNGTGQTISSGWTLTATPFKYV